MIFFPRQGTESRFANRFALLAFKTIENGKKLVGRKYRGTTFYSPSLCLRFHRLFCVQRRRRLNQLMHSKLSPQKTLKNAGVTRSCARFNHRFNLDSVTPPKFSSFCPVRIPTASASGLRSLFNKITSLRRS